MLSTKRSDLFIWRDERCAWTVAELQHCAEFKIVLLALTCRYFAVRLPYPASGTQLHSPALQFDIVLLLIFHKHVHALPRYQMVSSPHAEIGQTWVGCLPLDQKSLKHVATALAAIATIDSASFD